MGSGGGDFISVTVNPQLRNILGQWAKLRDTDVLARVQEALAGIGTTALEIARRHAPGDDGGAFKHGLSVTPYGDTGFAIISNNPQLLNWLRNGTGIYAGNGRIYPTSARVMVWEASRWARAPIPPNYMGLYVFASIAGMKKNLWEQDAWAEIQPQIDAPLRSLGRSWVSDLGFGQVVD